MSKTWNEMLPVKSKDELYILPAYMGVPPNLLKYSLSFQSINIHMQYTI